MVRANTARRFLVTPPGDVGSTLIAASGLLEAAKRAAIEFSMTIPQWPDRKVVVCGPNSPLKGVIATCDSSCRPSA
jgi:hypothetical protein